MKLTARECAERNLNFNSLVFFLYTFLQLHIYTILLLYVHTSINLLPTSNFIFIYSIFYSKLLQPLLTQP